MKKSQILEEIGHNIQLARMNKGLTQEQLAEKCNVSTQYIGTIERGKASGSILCICVNDVQQTFIKKIVAY